VTLATSVNQVEDDKDDGAPVAGITVGVLAAACCCCGVSGAGIWYYTKHTKQPDGIEVEVQSRTVPVVPGHQQQQQQNQ